MTLFQVKGLIQADSTKEESGGEDEEEESGNMSSTSSSSGKKRNIFLKVPYHVETLPS